MKQTQHYVPQFLLRRFAVARSRRHRAVHQVRVRDLKEDRSYLAAVPDVAAETGFYRLRAGGPEADWLEHRLGEIEELAAPALGRLVEAFNWHAHTDSKDPPAKPGALNGRPLKGARRQRQDTTWHHGLTSNG